MLAYMTIFIRVLKRGGRFLCLELSHVEVPILKELWVSVPLLRTKAVSESCICSKRKTKIVAINNFMSVLSQFVLVSLASHPLVLRKVLYYYLDCAKLYRNCLVVCCLSLHLKFSGSVKIFSKDYHALMNYWQAWNCH